MKPNIFAPFWTSLILLLCFSVAPLFAGQFGLFTYEVFEDTVAITDYPEDAVGDVEIPAEIDGKPVATIGGDAFWGCSGLTGVTIPESVTEIGNYAFFGCGGLTSVTISKGVTEIGWNAFLFCDGLTNVTISESVTEIRGDAFKGCIKLTNVVFLGDDPTGVLSGTEGVFSGTEITIYYLSSSTGFSSPKWNAYPTFMIDEKIYPAASWLLQHDLLYDTDLHDDASLLMAYALDLDPNGHMTPSLPKPLIDPATGALSLTFHAASPGITYSVETSADLQHWKTDGVSLSGPGPDNTMTASVGRDAPNQFMRLVVSGQ